MGKQYFGDIMENFKSTAAAICFVSAGICAVRSLVSGSVLRQKMELILKMVFAIVMLSHIINGFANIDLPNLSSYELTDYGYSQEKYQLELSRQSSINISEALRQQLVSNGINCEKISADVNISEDGGINITKVTVSSDDNDGAAAIIRNCLGADTEVEYVDN